MAIHFHEEDLPSADLFVPGATIAVDTEAMGLVPGRDRLCLVQLSDGSSDEHLVRFAPDSDFAAPNLKALLAGPDLYRSSRPQRAGQGAAWHRSVQAAADQRLGRGGDQ